MQTLPVDYSNNSKMENKIIFLIISICHTSINKIQLKYFFKQLYNEQVLKNHLFHHIWVTSVAILLLSFW